MYRKTVLPKGMKIVSHSMKDRDSVALGFFIASGGRYEEDRVKGVAHFLEHILFKGSKKFSCNQIKESIEGVGGSLNGFTSDDKTCYYAKIPARHMKTAFDVLSDMICHPIIASKDVKKERTVIMEEIKMYYDMPHFYVLDLLDGLVWPGHPLGKSLTGTMESVSAMAAEDLRFFRRKFYTPNRVIVSACGQLEHGELVQLTQRKFRPLFNAEPATCIPADNSQNAPRIKFERRKIEQMHLALGMLGLHERHKARYVLGLLHIILGGNMSSRLFNQIREKHGLAYSISTSIKFFEDTGMFLVRAGVDNNKILEAMALILQELKRIKSHPVSADELRRAKDYFLGQTVLGLEDTLEHMLWLGDSLMSLGHLRTLKEIVAEIEAITAADIQRVAAEIFREKRFNLAIIGPLKDNQERQLRAAMKIA